MQLLSKQDSVSLDSKLEVLRLATRARHGVVVELLKRVIEAERRMFNQRKHKLAVDFLGEIDEKVAGGRLAAKTAWSGGVQLIWNKRFRTTAGEAIEKTVTSDFSDDNGTESTMNQHQAWIKLSEYVVDDEGIWNIYLS